MPFDDRESKFERALAQHLRGGPAQANCPDAETLAAYHERNLSLEEMARWKEHISACEACQEALALVETTENQLAEDWQERRVPALEALSMAGAEAGRAVTRLAQPPVSAVPQAAASPVAMIRRRPALLRWAIPLGAVAAGVLVFIGIYEQRAAKVAHYSDTVTARREAPQQAPSTALDQLQSKVQQQSEPKDEGLTAAEMSAPKKEKAVVAAPSPRQADGVGSTGGAGFVNGKPDYAAAANKKKATPPAPAPEISGGFSAGAGTGVSQNVPVAAAAPRPSPPPPAMAYGGNVGGAAGEQRSRPDAKTAPPSVNQTVTVESAAPQVDTTSSMMKQGIDTRNVTSLNTLVSRSEFILSPDNKVWWKLGPGGTVELTTDGGKEWKSLDTGAGSQLTAGAAPSSKVCWIAGRSGTLLLTKDRGTHWSRINTPIAGDLGGVRATDAKHASIWDAARHTSYETSDGGSTWQQTTNQ